MEILSKSELNKLREFCLKWFWFFAQTFTDPDYFDVGLHRELCEFLQQKVGEGVVKVVILPRTFIKTTIAGKLYPLWRATREPKIRCLITSNTSPNAEKTVHSIRTMVESNKFYQALFPEVIPKFNKVRWSDRCACLNREEDYPEGTFEAAGVGANIIRRHYNLIVEDDTVAPKKDDLTGQEAMPSRDDIEKAVGFHKLTIPLLINSDDERLVVGTRWCDYDHINWILENEKCVVFDRPALVEGKPTYKRFSLERLEGIRMSMGTYMFSALYLNKPKAREFMTFKPEWIRYYEEEELPEEGDVVVTIDPADPPSSKKSLGDFSAIVSVKHTKKGLFVRRYRRERLSDAELIKRAFEVAEIDGAVKIRVEVNKYAHLESAFRDEMRRRGKWFIIEAVKAKLIAKEARIKLRLAPLFENGVIRLKRGMRELEEELFSFPYGSHDDLVDALSWQIDRSLNVEYERKEERNRIPKEFRMSWKLEEIRKSVRRGVMAGFNYPFQKQLGGNFNF
ncbi:MAG: hypothetical protein DRN14_03285 [Thermoplasmata archaeon]|nr:MAG: hypothetical protein DRN14_03285 [Thermoplasmata archaeon]